MFQYEIGIYNPSSDTDCRYILHDLKRLFTILIPNKYLIKGHELQVHNGVKVFLNSHLNSQYLYLYNKFSTLLN